MAAMDSDAQAREVERDIERTRNEMDATLSELERRLAPSEIVHQGAETVRETVRERARGLATQTVDTLKRHPVPVAVIVGLAVARWAYRPSTEERLRMRADEDLDRAWRVLQTGITRAKEEAMAREADLERRAGAFLSDARAQLDPALRAAGRLAQRGGADAWQLLQHAATTSRNAAQVVRDGSANRPLATLVLVGLAAILGLRRMRSA